jgi:hypothetical protein
MAMAPYKPKTEEKPVGQVEPCPEILAYRERLQGFMRGEHKEAVKDE